MTTLCLRPVVFLRMFLLQRRDGAEEIVSFSFVHFDLSEASVRICFGDHPLRLSKFSFGALKLCRGTKAKIRNIMSAVCSHATALRLDDDQSDWSG